MMKTKDIYFAAFLVDQGHRPINYVKTGHIVEFEFDILDTMIKEVRLDYINSEFNKVKTKIETLKGLI